MNSTGVVERWKDLFRQLDRDHLELLDDVFAPDVRFIDPFHEVIGLEEVRRYLGRSYENALSCTFSFGEELVADGRAYVAWTMTLRHKRLRGGREFDLNGVSYLEFDERHVLLHRDYFDAGVLYEQVPVLGAVVGFLRRRF